MQNKKLSHSIILICISLLLVVTLYLSVIGMRSTVKDQASDQLVTIRDLQAKRLEDSLELMRKQVQNLASIPSTITAMRQFSKNFYQYAEQSTKEDIAKAKVNAQNFYQDTFANSLKKETSLLLSQETLVQMMKLPKYGMLLQQDYIIENIHSFDEKYKLLIAKADENWSQTHQKYHGAFRDYMLQSPFADLLLIDLEKQNIVYSVTKQIDFATSLSIGPFRNTPLAYAYEDARSALSADFTKITDLVAYIPSKGKATSFISAPIYDGEKKIGVVVAKFYYDVVNDIMADERLWKKIGWGDTTETYVIGRDNKMRTNSRMFVEKRQDYISLQNGTAMKDVVPQILATNTTTLLQTTDYYFAEKTGCDTSVNYYGQEAIVAHTNLNDRDLQWIVIAEQNLYEPFLQIREFENAIWICFAILFTLIFVFMYISNRNSKQEAFQLMQRLTYELSSIHQQVNQMGRRGNKLLKKCDTNIELTTNFHHKVVSFNKDFIEDKEKAKSIHGSFTEIDEKLQENLQSMQHFARSLSEVEEALAQIKNMILIMENVAKETHIVSLNASIRAAREGNSSFSSVADEIRKLALKNAEVLEQTSEKMESAQRVVRRHNSDFQNIEEKSQTIEEQIKKASKVQSKVVDLKQRLLIYLDNLASQTQDSKFSCAYLQRDLEQIASESSQLTNQIENVAHNLKKIEF